MASKATNLQKPQAPMRLRDYQTEALDTIRDKYHAGCRRQLVKLPTGTGKTMLFANLLSHMGLAGRLMVLVHRDELVRQAADKLSLWNPGASIGIEKASEYAGAARLVVASVPTIGLSTKRADERLRSFAPHSFDALVIDEAHHAVADTYRTVVDHFRQNDRLLLVGVTATPNRADGEGLDQVFDEITVDRDILWGIRSGWLVNMRGYRAKTHTDITEVRSTHGDFVESDLSKVINTPDRNRILVDAWVAYGRDRQTIVFTGDIQHAKDVATMFQRRGIRATAVWGNDPDRKEKLAAHRTGDLKVVVNCALLTEGYDDWRVGCVMFARPLRSETLYTQICGRGTRIEDGVGNLVDALKAGLKTKEDCIVIDLVDNTRRHKLVTLSSLAGMSQDADLDGDTFTNAIDAVERLRSEYPNKRPKSFKSLAELAGYEEVDLFARYEFPEELTAFAKFSWVKGGDDMYFLSLPDKERVTVKKDILGHWSLRLWREVAPIGDINDPFSHRNTAATLSNLLRVPAVPDLAAAIKKAEQAVELTRPQARGLLARKASWRGNPPTEKQLALCRRLGILVSQAATCGQVSAAISAAFGGAR
jgi:superfamily II DNA or RNA helicase